MRILLDTHTFLWWLDGDKRLPLRIRRQILDEANEILVSAASAWEVSTKVRIGKLDRAGEIAESFSRCIRNQGFTPLSMTVEHAQSAGLLHVLHRDPFDRMLAAQSLMENIPLVSNDHAFDGFGVRRIW